ncbi:hypothetical protein GOP47_0007771 [Adiantum capillus-veneris]|uniref:Uncharacterized protein n=1 Tax=Adiantum capillus-veneris TaxID=13818 RepID=A0A9D4ZL95_ADICA|nr:hypothetical protein GOP47_0007771 [Adiantum capillus-veneris]
MARLMVPWKGAHSAQFRPAAQVSPPWRPCSLPTPLFKPAVSAAAFWRGRGDTPLTRPFLPSFARAHCERQGKHRATGPVQNPAVLQACLWLLASVYVFWLFILPYAPGDPVWAIKLDTITMILDLSLNFLFILPLTNLLGIHVLESPAVHPTAEALFNLVMGWSIMFAPMLFTDERRKRYSGSLVALWGIQMFLTNTVLIPYMAIRLNHEDRINEDVLSKTGSVKLELSGVQKVMVSGARVVSVVCGAVGLISVLWFFLGRADEGFGNFSDRWTFFLEYLASDRPGYAFVWDICLYSLFQPWLIGDNLDKVQKRKSEIIGYLRFIPYVGLVAYLWSLSDFEELEA